jgi:hypothetical protein
MTMKTSRRSFAFTDNFGANISMRITDRFGVGAQLYDRNTAASLNHAMPGNPDLPGHHERDKVFTCRFDLARFWNSQVEARFIDCYNNNQYPTGFYTPANPRRLKRNTKLLVIRTGINFQERS